MWCVRDGTIGCRPYMLHAKSPVNRHLTLSPGKLREEKSRRVLIEQALAYNTQNVLSNAIRPLEGPRGCRQCRLLGFSGEMLRSLTCNHNG